MNISDIFFSSISEEENCNMDNISMNYDNADLMSSEFFDSVLCLENGLEEDFLPNFDNDDDDNNLSSNDTNHSDGGILSPESFYSENSDKISSTSSSSSSSIETVTDDTESSTILNNIDGLNDPLLLSFLDNINNSPISQEIPQKIIKPLIAPKIVPSTTQRTTKILIQNPTNKKCITKPILNTSQFKQQKTIPKMKPQLIKVQQLNNISSGRPVLLPLSFKSIKILNTTTTTTATTNHDVAALNTKKRKIIPTSINLVENNDDEEDEDDEDEEIERKNHQHHHHHYPLLSLSNEEKRLLTKEGIQLPTHYPLTKNEERELKRIRRKIRNKISAQDSRKRKKEYVDGLEERVKRGSEENKNLLQRVKELQKQNRTLIAHVNRLQALICKTSSSKATPSTCLMVVFLSALLVSLPNMRLFDNKKISNEQQQQSEQINIRRSLLSDLQATEEDSLNMDEFLVFKDDEPDYDNKFTINNNDDIIIAENNNSTGKEFAKILENASMKYDNLITTTIEEKNAESNKTSLIAKMMETMKNLMKNDKKSTLLGGNFNRNGFIEPDIDDYHPGDEGPPLKRTKFDNNNFEINSAKIIEGETLISSTTTTTTMRNQVIKNQ